MRKPSRILNDNTLFFGIDRNDLMGLGLAFYFYQIILPTGLQGYAWFSTLITAVILIHIRLKWRRRIIRDSVRYYFFKFAYLGVYNDPKTSL